MVSCHVTDIIKYVYGLKAVHCILMAAIGFTVPLISTATIVSWAISILFGSMVSCRVADIIKYVCGVQLVHSILMAAIVLMVSLISMITIVSRPISILFG